MISFLVALAALLGLALTSFGVIRLQKARRLRDEEARWSRLAAELGGELRVGENGRLSITGARDRIEWELHRAYGWLARPGIELRFEGADRLAAASVWSDAPDDEEKLERLGSEEFRTVFEVQQAEIAAGHVRWIEDAECQDLLLAARPYLASVIAPPSAMPRTIVSVVFEEVDVDGIRLAIEWADRLARLARDGVAAAPPH